MASRPILTFSMRSKDEEQLQEIKFPTKPERHNADISKEDFANRFRWGGPHNQLEKIMFFFHSVKGRTTRQELADFVGIKRSLEPVLKDLVQKRIIVLEGSEIVHDDSITRCRLCWTSEGRNRWIYQYQKWEHLQKYHHFSERTLEIYEGGLDAWFSDKNPHPKKLHVWGPPTFEDNEVTLTCLDCSETQTLHLDKTGYECEHAEDVTPKLKPDD